MFDAHLRIDLLSVQRITDLLAPLIEESEHLFHKRAIANYHIDLGLALQHVTIGRTQLHKVDVETHFTTRQVDIFAQLSPVLGSCAVVVIQLGMLVDEEIFQAAYASEASFLRASA